MTTLTVRQQQRWLASVGLCGIATVILCDQLVPYRFVSAGGLLGSGVHYFPALVVSVLLVLRLIFRADEIARLWADPLRVPVVVLLAVEILSSIGGITPLQSMQKVGYYFLTGPVIYALVRWQVTERSRDRMVVLWLLTGTAGLAAAYGVSEFVVGESWLYGGTFYESNPRYAGLIGQAQFGGRIRGAAGHPVVYAGLLLLSLPACVLLACQRRRLQRLLGAGAAVLSVVALFLTFSRGAWLGLFAGVAVYCVCTGRRALVLTLAGFATVAAVALGSGKFVDVTGDRDPYSEFVQNFGNNARIKAYSYTAQILPRDLLLGSGLGTYQIRARPLGSALNTPDNMYLLRLAETGLMGLIALLYLLWRILKVVSPASHATPPDELGGAALTAVVFAGLVGFMVEMATFDALHFASIRTLLWTLLGICCTDKVAEGPRATCGIQAL